jgi:hypothetical protein
MWYLKTSGHRVQRPESFHSIALKILSPLPDLQI